MKRMLVATDLSERSDRAVDRAIRLASLFAAEVRVLHVVDEDLPTSVADKQKAAAQKNLAEHLSSLPEAAQPSIVGSVEFGRDWLEIIRQASAYKADLIILGVHRDRGIEGLFEGTTVERILRKGDIPVLVVKDRPTHDYRTIVIGVDFSVYSRRALAFAMDLAPDAHINLVHAYHIPFKGFVTGAHQASDVRKKYQEQIEQLVEGEMNDFLRGVSVDSVAISTVMMEGAPHEALHKIVNDVEADLVVVGTHGRTGMARALLGSVAASILNDSPCDVAAVQAW